MKNTDDFDSDYLSAWEVFAKVVPSEKHAVEIVYRILYRDKPLRCMYCRSTHHSRVFGSRSSRCMACSKKTWITSGTFFHKAKCLRSILAAFWFLESRVYINPFRFHKLLDIGYAAAILIFKKISMAICNQDDQSLVSIPSSEFREVICRRSIQTRALEHPVSEIQDSYDLLASKPDQIEDRDAVATLSEQEQMIYNVLSDQPQNVDLICFKTGMSASVVSATLVLLELSSYAHLLPGGCYIRSLSSNQKTLDSRQVDHSEFEDNRTKILLNFIEQRFRGVSRKYLQNYASLFWFYFDLKCWYPGRLLDVCKAFGKISGRQVSAFLSPYQISAYLI